MIRHMVEKPKRRMMAPSNLGVVGRYVLPGSIFDLLEKTRPGAGGEIQLTDAIATLLEQQKVYAYRFEGTRFDCGSKPGLVKATLHFAMQDAELAGVVRQSLQDSDHAPGNEKPLVCAAMQAAKIRVLSVCDRSGTIMPNKSRVPHDLSYILNHLGEDREAWRGAVSAPIFQTSIFAFQDVASMRDGFRDELRNTSIHARQQSHASRFCAKRSRHWKVRKIA